MRKSLYQPWTERTGPEVVTCKSWERFMEEVRFPKWPGKRLFRGQRDPAWGLLPTLFRRPELSSADARREASVTQLGLFQHKVRGLQSVHISDLITENDWWAFGQMNGLHTPFLDWTGSPYIAVYFAASDAIGQGYRVSIPRNSPSRQSNGFFAVWELTPDASIVEHRPFSVISVRPHHSTRQRAQDGFFTRVEDDEEPDLSKVRNGLRHGFLLRCFLIPNDDLIHAMADLGFMNISGAVLFPDPGGVAESVNYETSMATMVGVLSANTLFIDRNLKRERKRPPSNETKTASPAQGRKPEALPPR